MQSAVKCTEVGSTRVVFLWLEECSTPGAHMERVGLDGSHYHILLVGVLEAGDNHGQSHWLLLCSPHYDILLVWKGKVQRSFSQDKANIPISIHTTVKRDHVAAGLCGYFAAARGSLCRI